MLVFVLNSILCICVKLDIGCNVLNTLILQHAIMALFNSTLHTMCLGKRSVTLVLRVGSADYNLHC